MGAEEKPTIKGVFVMSHVNALKRARGERAVEELERRYGKPIAFSLTQDVPVREEVRIIELTLDLLSDDPPVGELREFEAGKLHFTNFIETPMGSMLTPIMRSNFKSLVMGSARIAERVFRGVHFNSKELGPTEVRVEMANTDYPLGHFRGFFKAWLEYAELKGDVFAEDLGDNRYAYTLRWRAPGLE